MSNKTIGQQIDALIDGIPDEAAAEVKAAILFALRTHKARLEMRQKLGDTVPRAFVESNDLSTLVTPGLRARNVDESAILFAEQVGEIMNGAIRKTKITAQHENIINHMGYLLMLEGHASMIKGLTMLTDLSSMDVAEEGTTWADVDALYAKVSTDDDAPVTAA